MNRTPALAIRTPSAATLTTAAQTTTTPPTTPAQAAQAIYQTLPRQSIGSWATSGVVSKAGQLWLTVAVELNGNPPKSSETIYKWVTGNWKAEAHIGAPLMINGNPDPYDRIGTAALTGSRKPNFLLRGIGADTAYLSVLAYVSGKWEAVPFVDSSGTGPLAVIERVSAHTVTAAYNSCTPDCAQAKVTTWQMHYVDGKFVPTESRSACGGESLALAAHAYQRATIPSDQSDAIYAFACDQGWALASATNCEEGFAFALRVEHGAWKVILFGNLIPPGVVPPTIYKVLSAAVLKAYHHTYFPY